jgi:hypothetical protein
MVLAAAVVLTQLACGPAPRPAPKPGIPPPASVRAPDRPAELRIRELTVDPAKTVRIKGVISSIVGIRAMPATVIFKITDSTETITVVINEQVRLREGATIELVGKYKEVPSPSHSGAGEPPREAVFVVERYLDGQ